MICASRWSSLPHHLCLGLLTTCRIKRKLSRTPQQLIDSQRVVEDHLCYSLSTPLRQSSMSLVTIGEGDMEDNLDKKLANSYKFNNVNVLCFYTR